VRRLAAQVKEGRLEPDDITEAHIARELYAADLPDPDLLIRTAGELRVSNFLLWQVAYTEMWVTQDMWPDFTIEHLVCAIESYQNRVRKFGGLANE